MALDPEYAQLLSLMDQAGVTAPYGESSAAEIRARMAVLEKMRKSDSPCSESDMTLPGPQEPIAIRLYRPPIDGVLPVIVYFHGGGFVIGNLDSHAHICQDLAQRCGALLISVDYRLAPEHRFPAAIEDAYAAVCWIAAQAHRFGADGARLAVAGDSAGGNLATLCCMRARDESGPPIRFQLLAYPGTHIRSAFPSRIENGEGYFLTTEVIDWFYRNYLRSEDQQDHPWASPLLAADLGRLPPALVITAEFDPLRDEGEAYARRLADAGVIARSSRYAGAIHGFLGPSTRLGRAALYEAADALRAALQ